MYGANSVKTQLVVPKILVNVFQIQFQAFNNIDVLFFLRISKWFERKEGNM